MSLLPISHNIFLRISRQPFKLFSLLPLRRFSLARRLFFSVSSDTAHHRKRDESLRCCVAANIRSFRCWSETSVTYFFKYIKFPVWKLERAPRRNKLHRCAGKIMKCKQQHNFRSLLPFVIIMQTHCAAVATRQWLNRHQNYPRSIIGGGRLFSLSPSLDPILQCDKCKCVPRATVNSITLALRQLTNFHHAFSPRSIFLVYFSICQVNFHWRLWCKISAFVGYILHRKHV